MNISDLTVQNKDVVHLADVFLSNENLGQFTQLIKEHQYIKELAQYGIPVNNKIMLAGSSGCGKTTTAKAIAYALSKPIVIINLSTVISSRIGETSQHVKLLFDKAARDKAVLFLDEFDQLAKSRISDEKDVGEMRRLVNTIIQLIDYLPHDTLLIAATNHPELIDHAIKRRFQLHVDFQMPAMAVLDHYYDKILAAVPTKYRNIDRVYEVSFAEAKDYAFTVVKKELIADLDRGYLEC